MARIRIPAVTKDLENGYVRVVVPIQQSGVDIIIDELTLLDGEDQDDFKVITTLGNFQVLFKENDAEHPIEFFDPPMEIIVCYDAEVVGQVIERKRPLKLGVYVIDKITEKGRWWILPTTEAIPCPHENGSHDGAFKILITGRWADPEVGWGT